MRKNNKIKLLLTITILSIIAFASYYTANYTTYTAPPLWKKVNLEKAGVVSEFNISVTKYNLYRFMFSYIQDKKTFIKEFYEADAEYKKNKDPNKDRDIEVYKKTTKGQIIGHHAGIIPSTGKYSKMKWEGSKIILKLTVTPLFDYQDDYEYYRVDKRPVPIKSEKISSHNKPFSITMDLSKYPRFASSVAQDQDDLKRKERDTAILKRIVELYLPKGDYHIKLENFSGVPEITKIRTNFLIEKATYAK